MSGLQPFPGLGTIAVHGGHRAENSEMLQVVPPISVATTYKQEVPGEPKVYDYGRAGNPTRDALERNLAALEQAKYCRVFSSGLATTSAITNLLKAGDHLVCNDDGYGGTQRFFRKVSVAQHGLSVDMVDLTSMDALKSSLRPETRMVWFETPSNPLLKIADIQMVTETVRAFNKDILIVVDNTFMTPCFQRPLGFGVDLVIHSLTKYINGHTDVIMGAALTNRPDLEQHLFFMQLAVGAIPSAFDCFLVHRGIKTLHLRMRAHAQNGLAVARWLEADARVERVLYPPLESHPQHALHAKQACGMSGMLSFYIKGGLQEAKTFLSKLKLFTLAESLGGYESLAELPAVMTHASVPADERAKIGLTDNLVRLSVGVEDQEDLINDLNQALSAAVKA